VHLHAIPHLQSRHDQVCAPSKVQRLQGCKSPTETHRWCTLLLQAQNRGGEVPSGQWRMADEWK
jgi:hypothetical protein